MNAAIDNAVILSACRTPIGTFGGVFKEVSAVDLGATAIEAAISRSGIRADALDDVIMGCVLQAGAGMNVARQAAIKAGVPVEVPAETVNRVCGSGLQAVIHIAEGIRAGSTQLAVGGGTESMSNAPYLARGARWGMRMGSASLADSMIDDGLTCALADCHMGVTAEEVAARYEISRDDQDTFAAESQRRAATAQQNGWFDREMVPVLVPQRRGEPTAVRLDEHPRPSATADSLKGLRPAFKDRGTVTAGNASGINDGASALVVASERRAAELDAQPLARILSYASAGVEPMIMGLGPIPAIRRALERAHLAADEVDLFEINEAFAAQSIAVVRELGLDSSRVNVNGGAIALGHPIGASGARILTTLIHELRRRRQRIGVAALCIGGGQGIAMVIEVLV